MNPLNSTGLSDLVPSEFHLSQNYPNPFSETTVIKLCVAYKTKATLEVFNSEGVMVKRLLDEEKEAGTYEVEFDACKLSEGIYTYQLQAGDFSPKKTMLLSR